MDSGTEGLIWVNLVTLHKTNPHILEYPSKDPSGIVLEFTDTLLKHIYISICIAPQVYNYQQCYEIRSFFNIKLFSSSLVLLVFIESLCDLQSFNLSGPIHLHNESFDLEYQSPLQTLNYQDSTSYIHLMIYHLVAGSNQTLPFQRCLHLSNAFLG